MSAKRRSKSRTFELTHHESNARSTTCAHGICRIVAQRVEEGDESDDTEFRIEGGQVLLAVKVTDVDRAGR